MTHDAQCDMKLIPLTKGMVAKIDDADFDWISKSRWHFSKRGYAVKSGPEKHTMHRLILETPNGMHTDHINGDKLDNRRSNLRIATASQNGANGPVRKNNLIGVKGVSKSVNKTTRWRARIKFQNKQISLGCFDTPEQAGEAYITAAKKYFGEFAKA